MANLARQQHLWEKNQDVTNPEMEKNVGPQKGQFAQDRIAHYMAHVRQCALCTQDELCIQDEPSSSFTSIQTPRAF